MTSFPIPSIAVLASVLILPICSASAQQVKASGLAVASEATELKAIPDGRYLVTLEIAGGKPRINVEVKAGTVKSIKASDAEFEGLEGGVEAMRPGIFVIRMRNQRHTISQVWVFRKDGSAAVREIPDRGEMQTAVPIKGDALELPK